MFPRDRVMGSLTKYSIAFDESETTEDLRAKLAEFYAARTITRRPIMPADCAQAICWLAGDASARTTGHVIPGGRRICRRRSCDEDCRCRLHRRSFAALDRFRIELPSWGFADTGTRFGVFHQPAAARTLEEKLADAGVRPQR